MSQMKVISIDGHGKNAYFVKPQIIFDGSLLVPGGISPRVS